MEPRDVMVKYITLWVWVLVDLCFARSSCVGLGSLWEVLALETAAALTLVKVLAVWWKWKDAVYSVSKQSVAGSI